MTQSSSIDIRQTILDPFGKFMSDSLEANPIRTFLVLVFILILCFVASSWVMVQWLASGTSNEVNPQKQYSSCSSADTVKARSKDTTSRSWSKKE